MYQGNDKNGLTFNPVDQSITVNKPLPDFVIRDFWHHSAS